MSIEKLKHFVSKEAFNIDGFGKKIVEKFWNLGFVKLPQDIFNLEYNRLENLEGWGKQSVANLKYSIEEKKNISFERFIFSLGIRHIGLEGAKLISKNLKSFENLNLLIQDKRFEDLANLDGIGDTQIKSIKNFFSNKTNQKIIKELTNILSIKNVKEVSTNGILKNKTFMFTGKLSNMSRSEAKSLIEQNSGSIVSNVSKKLDYLIIGEKPTKRKVDTARDLNVKILDQSTWFKMLNNTG